MTMLRASVVLAAGGTGGHVFPADALAEALLARGHGLALITDRCGADYGGTLAKIDSYRISAAGLGGGLVGLTRGVIALGRGLFQARRILKRLSPVAVVGFGGYPSAPTMAAAWRAGIPTLIHEQNAVLGRANRLLAGRISRIATSFATVAGIGPADTNKVVRTGNPVRAAITALRDDAYQPPANDGDFRLLVTGGSQGATAIGQIVPRAVAALPESLRRRITVAQQCRAEDIDDARATYLDAGVRVDVASFFDDIAERLGAAHLVIGRAGASTIAELACAGRPAILVPYPHATDDHQTANARALEEMGGAWRIDQADLTVETLSARLAELLGASETLARAAQAARAFDRGDAANLLADAVEALIADNRQTDEDAA